MTTAILIDNSHCSKGWLSFKSIRNLIQGGKEYTIGSDQKIITKAAKNLPPRSIDHLVIIGHGGATWIIDPDKGLNTQNVKDFAFAWRQALIKEPKVSLIADLCAQSLAPAIRDSLYYFGIKAEVRGRRSSPDIIFYPDMVSFRMPYKSQGVPWAELAYPGTFTSLGLAKWERCQQGEPTMQWLLYQR